MTQPQFSRKATQSVHAFLVEHGLGDARQERLPRDASQRSYVRLSGTNQLLMEDPSDPIGFAAFIRLARHLGALELSAPQVFAVEPSIGAALIEDFGTATYGALLHEGYDETKLYTLAIDTIVHLHSHPQATKVEVPAYDMEVLLEEVSRFSHWFVPTFAKDVDVDSFDAAFCDLWRKALTPLEAAPKALVLRDFHIDNLMLLEGREGIAGCGLLDFQDGVLGPAEYDLASLLQDARRDVGLDLEQAMLERYLTVIPAHCGTQDEILQRYHLMAAQRHTRLAGQFLRLYKRDDKPGYLQFMPRVLQQMQSALTTANLNEIGNFIDTALPGWRNAGPDLAEIS